MTQLGVASTSAVSGPRTTATATTAFPRSCDGAAFVAFGPDCRHPRGCWYLHYISIGKRNKEENAHLSLVSHAVHDKANKLTFACLHAFRPPVINTFVKSSAVLEPSTTRSAATDSAGFLERAAPWARDRISDRWGDG